MPDATDSPGHRTNQLIRDLEWAINSTEPCQLRQQLRWHDGSTWFREWIASGAGLDDTVIDNLWAHRQGRIGHYFEALWEHYLAACPHWTVLLSHWPVRAPETGGKGIRTLGEIDLILGSDDVVMHIELAIKFYLRVTEDTTDRHDQWVGPGVRDTLGQKARHLWQRQLPLSRHHKVIEQIGRPVTDRYIVMKGRFFEPYSEGLPPAIPQWLTVSQWHALALRNRNGVQMPRRADWLTGSIRPHDDVTMIAGAGWPEQPTQILWRPENSRNSYWRFIVPDEWPHAARPSAARPSAARPNQAGTGLHDAGENRDG